MVNGTYGLFNAVYQNRGVLVTNAATATRANVNSKVAYSQTLYFLFKVRRARGIYRFPIIEKNEKKNKTTSV